MPSLRNNLIRLASENRDMRPKLLALLAAAEGKGDKVQVLNENGRKVWVTKETLKGPDARKYKPIKDKGGKPEKPKGNKGTPNLAKNHSIQVSVLTKDIDSADDPLAKAKEIHDALKGGEGRDALADANPKVYGKWDDTDFDAAQAQIQKKINRLEKSKKGSLRTAALRLAHDNKALRPHLLPLLTD